MNKWIGTGRPTSDPQIKLYGENNDKKMATYILACDRMVKRDPANPEQQTADFIRCLCYGYAADFADKYLRKGMKILVEGRIQTGRYQNNEGQTVFTTDVVVDKHEFCESKGSASGQTQQQDQTAPPQQTATTSAPQPAQAAPAQQQADMGFINIPDGIAAELPFN